jgi:hypothetical protein
MLSVLFCVLCHGELESTSKLAFARIIVEIERFEISNSKNVTPVTHSVPNVVAKLWFWTHDRRKAGIYSVTDYNFRYTNMGYPGKKIY